MRLWSLCPSLLDRKGLGGCWVEALLCQAVLAGRTKGYKQHPQLERWRACPSPLAAVGAYLSALQQEAQERGYNYNPGLILVPPPGPVLVTAAAVGAAAVANAEGAAEEATATTITTEAAAQALPPLVPTPPVMLEVTTGQLQYEMEHLLRKLERRDPEHCARVRELVRAREDGLLPHHPCFAVVPGGIASWEVVDDQGGKKKGSKSKKAKGAAASNEEVQATATDTTTSSSGGGGGKERERKRRRRGQQEGDEQEAEGADDDTIIIPEEEEAQQLEPDVVIEPTLRRGRSRRRKIEIK